MYSKTPGHSSPKVGPPHPQVEDLHRRIQAKARENFYLQLVEFTDMKPMNGDEGQHYIITGRNLHKSGPK